MRVGGRRWTVEEETLLRLGVAVARDRGLDTGARPRRGATGMLRAVARKLGRSYPAVRQKASQLGEGVRARRPRPPHPALAGEPPRAEEISEVHAELGRRSGEVRRAKVSDRDTRIVEARKAGLSQNEIARREGVSRGAVLKALARHRAKVA